MHRTPVRTHRLVAAAVALSLTAAACGGGESSDAPGGSDALEQERTGDADTATDSTSDTADTSDTATVSTVSTVSAVSTTSTSTTTTVPLVGADPSDPAPVGDPEFDLIGFESSGDVSDASMIGLVSVPVEGAGPGSCAVILHVVTIQATEGLASSATALPRATLYDGDGGELFPAVSGCDVSTLRVAGYVSSGFQAVAGTQVAVMTPFALEGGATPAAMSLGLSGAAERFYDTSLIGDVPPVVDLAVGDVPTDLDPVSTNAADAQRFGGGLSDSVSTFDIGVFGFVDTVRSESSDDPGRCVTVLGTLKGVEALGAIINSLAVPAVQIIAGGKLLGVRQSFGECDDGPLEDRGYFSDLGAGVAAGNTFAVQTAILVPEGVEPQAIVVGNPSTVDEFVAFEATPLAEIPPAPASEKLNPVLDTVPVGAPSAFGVDVSGTLWSGSISGLLPLTSNVVEEFVCLAVIGEIAGEGETRSTPSVGLVVDGRYIGRSSPLGLDCDVSALEAAGYVEQSETVESTESTRFYTVILVRADGDIAAIAVGNAASPDNVRYVEPTVLDAVPA